eukprot:841445_1
MVPTFDYVISKVAYLLIFMLIRFVFFGFVTFQLFVEYPETNPLYQYGILFHLLLAILLLPNLIKSTYKIIKKHRHMYAYHRVDEQSTASEIETELEPEI